MVAYMAEVGFTSQGYEALPSLTNDNEYTIGRLAELPQERLEELTDMYSSFLSGDIMPHHRDKAERFLQHLSFELAYRNGDFNS